MTEPDAMNMSVLELKIPPVAVALLIGAMAWLLASLGPPLPLPGQVRTGVALLLAGAGIGVAAAGVIEFLRAKTTINPHQPRHASSLVTTGIFGYTRNPMYLGLLLGLLAWAILLGQLMALAPLALFILYLDRFQIEPEERALSILFGKEFSAYRARVRRWI